MQENQNQVKANEPEVVEAEELNGEPGKVLQLDSAEHLIGVELKKFDTNKEKIAELKKLYSPLKINGEDDKAGYEQVHKAVGVLRPLRTGVEKTRKAAKEKYLKTGQGIDKYAKELTELIEEIENPLKAMLEEVDNAKENRRIEAEKALAAKLQQRKELLLANGMSYDGNTFRIEFEDRFQVASESELSLLEDNQFEVLLSTVKALKVLIDEAKEKAEKEAEENRKAVQKQQEEIAEMKAERSKLRSMRMESLGFVYSATTNGWGKRNKAGFVEIDAKDFGEISSEDWAEYEKNAVMVCNSLEQTLTQLEEKEKAEAEAKERFELRAKRLVGLGLKSEGEQLFYKDINFRNTDILCMPDNEFELEFNAAAERMENIKAEEEKELKEKQEREEKAAKSEALKKERIAFLVGKGFVHNTETNLVEFKGLYVEEGTWIDVDILSSYDDDLFSKAVIELDEAVANIKKADQAEIDRKAAEMEEKRKQGLNDAQKILEWIALIQEIEVPKVSTPELQQAVNIMVEGFDGLKASLLKTK